MVKASIIKSSLVRDAMLRVDRKHYIPNKNVLDDEIAYMDSPQRIGYNVTISAPHMHAFALEILKDHLVKGNRALDVGSGSGYLVACMAQMVGDSGKVIGLEYIPQLAKHSQECLSTETGLVYEMYKNKNLQIHEGDGWKGYESEAPYHAMHVGAAAATIPDMLIQQLANNGRLVVPVGPEGGSQELMVIDKDADGNIKKTSAMGVMYVPLVNPSKSK
ncbi:Pcmt [Acrasis kona]|uniref:protein-L-isoaspartate(D-aspartate) O-methyltransferase n=1 Tax=Acrasis kona TaxID=1008807 RepID=A0AAW2YL09_9EUKA